MSKRLEGKVVVVTGAGSGIGRASAILFAQEGAKLLASDITEAVHETAKLVEAEGGRVIAEVADAGDDAAVSGLCARAERELGELDGFFANAGISGDWQPIADTTVQDFETALRVNLIGPFLAIKHASALMTPRKRGSIVCTASVAALRANAGPFAYSASKAGVVSLAQTTSNALRGTGIRVNAVCPGLIETGMTKPIFEYARTLGCEDELGQLTAATRHGYPIEIAHAAAFLLSDQASYVNGQAIVVDGGLSSTHPFIPRAS